MTVNCIISSISRATPLTFTLNVKIPTVGRQGNRMMLGFRSQLDATQNQLCFHKESLGAAGLTYVKCNTV